MKITFDHEKRALTLKERGLDFKDAAAVFLSLVFEAEDLRNDYKEHRFFGLGLLHKPLVVVVRTPRGQGRRVISMRYAHEKERKKYGIILG